MADTDVIIVGGDDNTILTIEREVNIVTIDRVVEIQSSSDTTDTIVVAPDDSAIVTEEEVVNLVTSDEDPTLVVEIGVGPQGIQGPRGLQGPPGAQLPTVSVVAPSLVMTTIDTLSMAEYRTVKWIVTVIDLISNRIRSSEVFAHQTLAGDVSFSQSSVLGDSMNMKLSAVSTSGNIELQVLNDYPHSITVKAARMGTLSI